MPLPDSIKAKVYFLFRLILWSMKHQDGFNCWIQKVITVTKKWQEQNRHQAPTVMEYVPTKKRKMTESALQGGTLISDEYSQPTNVMKVRTCTCMCWLRFQFKLHAPHSSYLRQKVKVKSLSPIWLCDPKVHGVFQARVLEWVAISFSISDREHTQMILY